MKRIEKGSFGYRNYHLLRNAGITVLTALFILAQIAFARSRGGTTGVVFTLTGILCVLPFANMLAPLIAFMRFRTPDAAFQKELRPYEDRGILLYDLIFTTKEKAFPADAVLIRSGAVLVCGPENRGDAGKLKVHLENSLRLEKLKLHVNLYEGSGPFLKAVQQLPANGDIAAPEQKAAELLKSISF